MTIVNLTPMKAKALNFPEPLKSLILSEPDMIEASDFISKIGTWERLAKMSTKQEVVKQ